MLMTQESVTMPLRLSELLCLLIQEKGLPSRSAVNHEISQWVARSYIAQISIGKSGMDTTDVHFQKQRSNELNIARGRLSLRNYNAQVEGNYAMIKALNKLTGLGCLKLVVLNKKHTKSVGSASKPNCETKPLKIVV